MFQGGWGQKSYAKGKSCSKNVFEKNKKVPHFGRLLNFVKERLYTLHSKPTDISV